MPREGAAPNPTLIYIHGGGWVGGARESSWLQLLPYLDAGWSVVNVSYRLARISLAPAAVEDCRCALRWVRHESSGGTECRSQRRERRQDASRAFGFDGQPGPQLSGEPPAVNEEAGRKDSHSSSLRPLPIRAQANRFEKRRTATARRAMAVLRTGYLPGTTRSS